MAVPGGWLCASRKQNPTNRNHAFGGFSYNGQCLCSDYSSLLSSSEGCQALNFLPKVLSIQVLPTEQYPYLQNWTRSMFMSTIRRQAEILVICTRSSWKLKKLLVDCIRAEPVAYFLPHSPHLFSESVRDLYLYRRSNLITFVVDG